MHSSHGALQLSATDLSNFLGCKHRTALDMAVAAGARSWHKALAPFGDTTCSFRDSAFADDVARTNLAAILSQHGLANVRSL